jgi:hypothetical protein
MNGVQFNMTSTERENEIIKYIRANQGCTKADITRELQEIISKKTVYKIVDEKIKKNIIETRKQKKNSRDIKLFVREDNPAVIVPPQLEEIEIAFNNLLSKSERMWLDKQEIIDEEWKTLKFNLYIESLVGPESLFYFAPTMILRMVIDSITIHSTTRWIGKYADKSNLNTLLTDVFIKLSSLNIRYIDYLNNIQYHQIENAQFDNEAVNRVLSPLQLVYISRRIHKEIGIQEEIDKMLDSLWVFNKDIQNLLFPEIELYKWDFKPSVDSWKKIYEICENNPEQTAYNYYFGKRDDRNERELTS